MTCNLNRERDPDGPKQPGFIFCSKEGNIKVLLGIPVLVITNSARINPQRFIKILSQAVVQVNSLVSIINVWQIQQDVTVKMNVSMDLMNMSVVSECAI